MAFARGGFESFEPFRYPTRNYAADGTRYKVKLRHITSPENFYLTFSDEERRYSKFFDELNRVYLKMRDDNRLPRPLNNMGVGDQCIFQEHYFFRGQILKFKERREGLTADMIDVDTGELSRSVPLKHLYPTIKNNHFRQTPTFAVHCKLGDIVPPTPDVSMWDEELVTLFVDNYASRDLTCEFLGQEGDVYVVNLRMRSEREVADHMFATGLARRPNASSTGSQLPLLDLGAQIGDCVRVIISYVESSTSFYIQLERNEDLISKIGREVNFEYSRRAEVYRTATPKKGVYCAAKFDEDGHWYRALIVGRPSDKRVAVYFVDYGNTARISNDDIRELNLDFTKYPAQAVHCIMYGVRMTDVTLMELVNRIESQRMTVRIDDADTKNNVLMVTLIQTTNNRRFNINDYLLGNIHKPPPMPFVPLGRVARREFPESDHELDSDVEVAVSARKDMMRRRDR